jgi:hypothetical protein
MLWLFSSILSLPWGRFSHLRRKTEKIRQDRAKGIGYDREWSLLPCEVWGQIFMPQ